MRTDSLRRLRSLCGRECIRDWHVDFLPFTRFPSPVPKRFNRRFIELRKSCRTNDLNISDGASFRMERKSKKSGSFVMQASFTVGIIWFALSGHISKPRRLPQPFATWRMPFASTAAPTSVDRFCALSVNMIKSAATKTIRNLRVIRDLRD